MESGANSQERLSDKTGVKTGSVNSDGEDLVDECQRRLPKATESALRVNEVWPGTRNQSNAM